MRRPLIAMSGMLLVSAFVVSSCFKNSSRIEAGTGGGHASTDTCQAAGDDPPECRNLNQQWSGWVFGRIFGVSVPSLGPQAAPPPDLFGWK